MYLGEFMTNKGDLISVVIPAYNNGKYIDKCLNSIINQTYTNIEIIIINDCSTDDTEQIILKYKNKDERILYLKNDKNIGVGATRNRGIEVSKGRYIYFLDSDDYIELNCIENLYNAISEEYSFSCMTKGYKEINGEIIPHSRSCEELMLLQSPSVCIRLFNKKVIQESNVRFSNLKIGEDLEFVFKLMIYNNKISYVDMPLYTYVIHEDSSIRRYSKSQLDVIKAMEEVELYAKEIEKYNEFYEIIEFVNVSHILVGTIKRIRRFHDYDEKDIKLCIDVVNKKYPSWKENKYVLKYLMHNTELQSY